MRSIELTLDDEAEHAIRDDWAALIAAGLPSLGTHTGASNRPHITVAAGEELVDGAGLRDALSALPVGISFGGLLLFGEPARGVVLVRQVVMTGALLALHARVHAASLDALEQTRPGRWTPHVTLARRLPTADLPRALEVLGQPVGGAAVAARLWDGREKTVTDLGLDPAANPSDGTRAGSVEEQDAVVHEPADLGHERRE